MVGHDPRAILTEVEAGLNGKLGKTVCRWRDSFLYSLYSEIS